MKFLARSAIDENGKGKLEMSDYTRKSLHDFLKKNVGMRMEIKALIPESRNQRNFLHGAVYPLWAYLDGKDYRDRHVLEQMHEVAKIEFNGELVMIKGKPYKVGRSSKGKLRDGFLEDVIDYLVENYGIDAGKVLSPETYKHWRDTIFPYSDIDNFIDFMRKSGILK